MNLKTSQDEFFNIKFTLSKLSPSYNKHLKSRDHSSIPLPGTRKNYICHCCDASFKVGYFFLKFKISGKCQVVNHWLVWPGKLDMIFFL